jgi:small nuclear ribonucleoprotein (snRNP)-like protein
VPPVPAAAGRGAAPAFGGDEVANAAIAGRGAAAGGRGQPAPAGNVGGVPTTQQLAQSILEPNAVVSAVNRYVQLKMKDGKTISGKLLSVDTFAYQIFDSNEKLANIPKDSIREATMASPMPSYKDKLTNQELSDVISYLMTLKGQ